MDPKVLIRFVLEAALSLRHIHSFGGDPDHVTISGQSSVSIRNVVGEVHDEEKGAASVVYQMLAYGGTDVTLFQAAVGQILEYIKGAHQE